VRERGSEGKEADILRGFGFHVLPPSLRHVKTSSLYIS
jgi:hypothetical protein